VQFDPFRVIIAAKSGIVYQENARLLAFCPLSQPPAGLSKSDGQITSLIWTISAVLGAIYGHLSGILYQELAIAKFYQEQAASVLPLQPAPRRAREIRPSGYEPR